MMNKILNINENKLLAKKYVKKIEKILNENLKKQRKYIKENENPNNFMFLIDNFNKINNYLKSGNVTSLELQTINDDLNYMLNEDDALFNIYAILCFYNAYRIYNGEFLKLSKDDVKLITDLFVSFEQTCDITRLDGISDFIFDEQIMKELKSKALEYKKLFYICEDIVDIYLNDNMVTSVDHYAQEEIRFLNDDKTSVKK